MRDVCLYGTWVMFRWCLVALWGVGVAGHGRLVEPPGRSSMWRYGYDTPSNYLDNQLFCGGFSNQWTTQGGKCGPCGDPWQGPRENEAGGAYARGVIVRYYHPDSVMKVQVQLTAPHKGWFEFRLCYNNNISKPVTHACLNENLLELADGTGTKYYVTRTDAGMHKVDLLLPKERTCSQCVVQWKYNAGNSWNTDPETGAGCVGCGPQEQFYGCADVAIGHYEYDDSVILSDQAKVSGNLDEGGASPRKTQQEWTEDRKKKKEKKLIKYPKQTQAWAPNPKTQVNVTQLPNVNWWWIWNPTPAPASEPEQMFPAHAPNLTHVQWPFFPPHIYWTQETTTRGHVPSGHGSSGTVRTCFTWIALKVWLLTLLIDLLSK